MFVYFLYLFPIFNIDAFPGKDSIAPRRSDSCRKILGCGYGLARFVTDATNWIVRGFKKVGKGISSFL
jgi:hypothetical protein